MRNILRPKQLAEYLSISLPTIWRLQQAGDFPKKIQLSKKSVGWFEDEITAWLESRSLAKVKKLG